MKIQGICIYWIFKDCFLSEISLVQTGEMYTGFVKFKKWGKRRHAKWPILKYQVNEKLMKNAYTRKKY